MYNCIFSGHCLNDFPCSTSCPSLAQTSYLLERNDIKMTNSVFKMTDEELSKYVDILHKAEGQIASTIVSSNTFTNVAADAITYCAICEHWKGSQLHCTVYNLKFSQYIEAIQRSWSSYGESPEVDYMKIWASTAKVLVISSIDFVNFKEFQSQTLLSLLQSRMNSDLTTIIVSPPTSSLVGDGPFFGKLTSMISSRKVGENL